MMVNQVEQELIESVLARAADKLGDISKPVYDLFYTRSPDARALFVHHDSWAPARLEGSMIEQVIYCLLRWHESPGEVEIVLLTTLPHHIETLGVGHAMFACLLDAACDVIGATIPSANVDELRAFREVRGLLVEVIAMGAAAARPELARKIVLASG